jgi:methyl coenzyme M reductase gamma subunit
MALRNLGMSRSGERKRKAAREAVKQLEPGHREAIQASGYGPGDAYIGLWDELAELKNDQRQISKRLAKPALKPATKTFLAARYDELRDKVIAIFIDILPYERPKLAMVKYEGDGTGEIIDLKVLNSCPNDWEWICSSRNPTHKRTTAFRSRAQAAGIAARAHARFARDRVAGQSEQSRRCTSLHQSDAGGGADAGDRAACFACQRRI